MKQYNSFLLLICSYTFIDAVIASTADGVPLMRGIMYLQSLCIVINPQSTIDIGSEEVEFPVCLSIIAEQVE